MEKKIETMSLFMETAGFAPPITGEEICSSLRMVANHLEAIIPKGRNAWEVVCRAGDVATGLEVTGLVLRGRNVELNQRFPGGTWVRVRGLPLDAGDLTVRCLFENFGEVVSGPHHVVWRGTTIKTGDRTLKVKLVRDIPQSFSTLGGKTKVTVRYRDLPTLVGQQATRGGIAPHTTRAPTLRRWRTPLPMRWRTPLPVRWRLPKPMPWRTPPP